MRVKGALTGLGVALKTQHNFRRTVPSCRDVLGHVTGILLRIDGEATGQAKVANLQFAVRVDEQVTRFEIAMKHIGRVNVFQTTEDLVDERLEMRIGQGLPGANNSREVTLHQFCHRVRDSIVY